MSESVRSYWLKEIEHALGCLANVAGEPGDATVVASYKLWRVVAKTRAIRDLIPEDPVFDFVLAIHDGLMFRNQWTKYSSEQYREMQQVVECIASQQELNEKIVEEAITELEEIGIGTLPSFGFAEEVE